MLVLDYDQLLAISRNGAEHDQQSSSNSRRDDGRESDWEVAKACEESMGPNGNGFVAVRGMKNYATRRNRLLRLVQKLALLPNSERATILKVISKPLSNFFFQHFAKTGLSSSEAVWVFRVWDIFCNAIKQKHSPETTLHLQIHQSFPFHLSVYAAANSSAKFENYVIRLFKFFGKIDYASDYVALRYIHNQSYMSECVSSRKWCLCNDCLSCGLGHQRHLSCSHAPCSRYFSEGHTMSWI